MVRWNQKRMFDNLELFKWLIELQENKYWEKMWYKSGQIFEYNGVK